MVEDRVVYAETSKIEDTWYRVLRHYDAEFDTARRVLDGQWHGRHSIQYRFGRQPERVRSRQRQRRTVAEQ